MTLTAELARSVLDCPARVRLSIDDVLHAVGGEVGLELHDEDGTPTLVCVVSGPSAPLADGQVEVQVASAISDDASLTVAGQLRWMRRESCDCCGDVRSLVGVDLTEVVLERGTERVLIETAAFTDPSLGLNPGFLRRTQQHVNEGHVPELCESIARHVGTPVDDIVAAQLAGLSPLGVELQWVTSEGAERVRLGFAHRARTRADLRMRLRGALELTC